MESLCNIVKKSLCVALCEVRMLNVLRNTVVAYHSLVSHHEVGSTFVLKKVDPTS